MMQLVENIAISCQSTNCGETQGDICNVFAHNVKCFNHALQQLHLSPIQTEWEITQKYHLRQNEHKLSQIIEDMQKQTAFAKILFVDIQICDHIGHFFTLINDQQETIIVDSYIDVRRASARRFQWSDLVDLLTHPSIDIWNDVFMCDEKPTILDENDMYIMYSYT